MNALTYVFPAAAVVFIILFMWCCPGLRTAELESPQESREGFSKRDAAAVCIISAVYAVAAFWGLGNTQSAQSFCHFSERGDYAQIELETDTDITNGNMRRIETFSGFGCSGIIIGRASG